MIYFTKPVFLFFLLFVPILVVAHFVSLRLRKKRALRFANFEAIANIKGIDLLSRNIMSLIISSLIVVLLSCSLAGIQVSKISSASSFSFAIAIDASRSMEATDFSPSRLEAAKSTAISFVNIAPQSTRFAVVSFSGNSFIEQTATSDRYLVREAIKNIQLSTVGGTDLEEAVVTSSNLLKAEDGKAVILISDGNINIGTIETAIDYAKENQVIVNSIGIGSENGGDTTYGLSKIDEDSLKSLAFNTGGEYYKADSLERLQISFNTLLNLKEKQVFIDYSNYLLIAALILIILQFVLINTKFALFP